MRDDGAGVDDEARGLTLVIDQDITVQSPESTRRSASGGSAHAERGLGDADQSESEGGDEHDGREDRATDGDGPERDTDDGGEDEECDLEESNLVLGLCLSKEGRVAHDEIPLDGTPEYLEGLDADRDYFLIVEGTFEYSSAGRQDAGRRWKTLTRDYDPICFSCSYHEWIEGWVSENPFFLDLLGLLAQESGFSGLEMGWRGVLGNWGVTIDGVVPIALREDIGTHQYLFLANGASMLEMKSGAEVGGDLNRGGLSYSIYEIPSEYAALTKERLVDRLGIRVDPASHREFLGVDLEAYDDEPWEAVGDAEDLTLAERFRFEYSLPEVNATYLVEISGLGVTAPGVESDYGYERSLGESRANALLDDGRSSLIDFECSIVKLEGDDPWAHRYLVSVSGCGERLVANLTAGDSFYGHVDLVVYRKL
ncbi:MAG: hypothetical protein AAGF11_28600 [Myxococcota bacterium]